MVSTYAELDPLRKGSAAVELFSLLAFTVTAAVCGRQILRLTKGTRVELMEFSRGLLRNSKKEGSYRTIPC